MSYNYLKTVLGFIAVLGLSGCARYAARPLGRLSVIDYTMHSGGVSQEQSQRSVEPYVSFAYRALSAFDCKQYLDRDVIAAGYQPIHVTITNQSKRYLYFSLSSLNVVTVNPSSVALSVHTSTAKRVIGYGIAGLFVWPFLIAAAVDGTGSEKANKELDLDFEAKALRDQVILKPHEILNGLIFVPVDEYDQTLSFSLVDQATHERFVLTSKQRFLVV